MGLVFCTFAFRRNTMVDEMGSPVIYSVASAFVSGASSPNTGAPPGARALEARVANNAVHHDERNASALVLTVIDAPKAGGLFRVLCGSDRGGTDMDCVLD